METTGLLATLNSINILSPALQDAITNLVIEEHVSRKSIILAEGRVSHRIFFIKKGFVRAYYHKGRSEYTSWFMGEGDIIVSVYSFFSRRPSFENIQVLEDSVLQSINWNQLQSLPKFPRV